MNKPAGLFGVRVETNWILNGSDKLVKLDGVYFMGRDKWREICAEPDEAQRMRIVQALKLVEVR